MDGCHFLVQNIHTVCPAAEPATGSTQPVPTVTVNLDLPAELRWVEVVAPYKDQIAALVPVAFNMIPPELMPYLEVLLGDLDRYLGEPWKSELEGVAAACDLDIGDVVAMNLCL